MKILIVDDDAGMNELVKNRLMDESHVVEMALDGKEGSFLGRCYDYDAIILDYSMPKKDGLTVCKEIRQSGKNTPILFLSVTDDTQTKIMALNCGADDYMVKPFSLEELLARLLALTRRPRDLRKPVLEVGNLKLDVEKHEVRYKEKIITLTRKEYNMLEYFMRHPGRVISRSLLLEQVWNTDSDPLSNTVEAHIRNLRMKIAKNGRTLIINIPGRGYMIRADY